MESKLCIIYFILFIKLKFNYRVFLTIFLSFNSTLTQNSFPTFILDFDLHLQTKGLSNHTFFLTKNIVVMTSFTFTDPSSSLELLTIINSIHNLSITSTKEQVVIFNDVEPSRSNFISNRLQAGYGRLK